MRLSNINTMKEGLKKTEKDSDGSFPEDRMPFREVLKKTELRDFIYKIESRSDKIIRVLSKRRSEEIGMYRRGKELFDQLRSQYNIPIPDFDVVFGETEKGKITAFVIVDRIEGKDLDDIMKHPNDESLTKNIWRRVDEVFGNLVRYYADMYKRDGEYLSDISGPRQWRWGHRIGEKENRLWVVDVDPLFDHHDSNRPDLGGDIHLFNSVENIAYTTEDIKTSQGVVCEQTLKALRLFLKNVPESNPHRHKIENALR